MRFAQHVDVPAWIPFELGGTLGQRGSENGTIILDEEIPHCSRITLEQDAGTIPIPFAITVGVYELLVHTLFFGTQKAALQEYEAVKKEVDAIVEAILIYESSDDPDVEGPAKRRMYALAKRLVESHQGQ